MRKNKYTISEIKILSENPNVNTIKYGSRIEYKPAFKLWAVTQSIKHPEMSANDIFEMAGFDPNIIGSRTAESRIRYWKGIYFENKNPNLNPREEIHDTEINKQNNKMLYILLSKFDKLLEALGNRNGK